MNQKILADILSKRLIICIAFHYDGKRLTYLARVLKSLSQFMVKELHIVITTSTVNINEINNIINICNNFRSDIINFDIKSYVNLSHPFMLTWAHKHIVKDVFLTKDSRFDHFIYIEDDIQFSFINYCYFVQYRPLLQSSGIVPAFVRVEYNQATHDFVASDCGGEPYVIDTDKVVDAGDYWFANPFNPYNAMYILDRDLAEEYVASVSFDVSASTAITDWCLRERSAMGLTFENIPAGFDYRLAVPVNKSTGQTPSFCWIYHLPNNYADNMLVQTGTVPMTKLFAS